MACCSPCYWARLTGVFPIGHDILAFYSPYGSAMNKHITLALLASLFLSSTDAADAQGFGSAIGGAIGSAVGAATGGRNPVSGSIVGGVIGGAMGAILDQLSQQERERREAALQQAARGKSAAWSSSGESPKKARYVNKGRVASTDGKKCSRVEETITLVDGTQGTSEETVCFS
jgi:outer membrane protein with glycine zipper